MKLLCVFDPFVLFPPPRFETEGSQSFFEHDRARQLLGFKVVLSSYLSDMLCSMPDIPQSNLGGMYAVLFSYLTGPERKNYFFEVDTSIHSSSMKSTARSILPHERHPNDSDLEQMYLDLMKLCSYLHKNHSAKTRYASGVRDGEAASELQLADSQDPTHIIPVTRNRHDWRENYRTLRSHPADKLPSIDSLPQRHHAVLPFCPPADFIEDQMDLSREPLDDHMVRQRKWQRPKGKAGKSVGGYYDRWGNCWVWNAQANHWDVQITDQFKNSLKAQQKNKNPDNHLNVQPASDRFPGEIVHGYPPTQESLNYYVNNVET